MFGWENGCGRGVVKVWFGVWMGTVWGGVQGVMGWKGLTEEGLPALLFPSNSTGRSFVVQSRERALAVFPAIDWDFDPQLTGTSLYHRRCVDSVAMAASCVLGGMWH